MLSAERSLLMNTETEFGICRGLTHEYLSAERSLLMDVETEPGT